MDTFKVQVRRVVRHGGANVRVIDGKFAYQAESAKYRRLLPERAAELVEEVPDMVGYVVMAWDSRGFCSVGLANGVSSPVRDHMLPTFVSEKIRAQLIEHAVLTELRGNR